MNSTVTTTKRVAVRCCLCLALLLATSNVVENVTSFSTTSVSSTLASRRKSSPLFLTVLKLSPGGGHAAATDQIPAPVTCESTESAGATSSTVADESAVAVPDIPAGTASIPSEVFNLIKSIVGAGVLGLPAGLAAVGDHPSITVPSLLLLFSIGALSAHGFSMIGAVCAATRTVSYRQAWSKSVGESTAWIPASACLLVTACSVLCYSMILADTVPAIVQFVTAGLLQVSRTTALLGITGTVLLPLCLMQSLKRLAPFSLIGILGMVYTAACMTFRWLSGAYHPTKGIFPASALAAEMLVPRFGVTGWRSVVAAPASAAILVSMLSTAYMAHYNAPKFYWELRNVTAARFQTVVTSSFAGAVLLMAVTALAGFNTFGAAASPLILNNYAVTDRLMSISRVAVTLSLLFSYPLAFVGVREGLLDLLKVSGTERRSKLSNPLTVALLGVITSMALVLKDIGIILALGGATWGNCVIYLFPAFMVWKGANSPYVVSASDKSCLKRQRPAALATCLVGLCLGIVGTVRALSKW